MAEMRTALGRLGFTTEASAAIVDDQTIDSIEELQILTDDEIKQLCKVVRYPGGTIPNPAIDAADTAAEAATVQPRTVPNPGLPVSLRAENNMKLAAYWARYKRNTSRTIAPADITLTNVRKIRGHREWEENQEDPEVPEGIISTKDWTKTMEALEEHIRGHLGVCGIPLSYVIRKSEEPEDDPATGDWPSAQDELVGRAPITAQGHTPQATAYTDEFKSDNLKVWEIISTLTREHECWTYVKVHQRKRDGRGAFWALHNHYLGPNNLDNMVSSAERKLQTISYSGERKRWNFERYVRTHTEQHTILNGLRTQGYSGVDERSKVRMLIDGIKTKELDAVKAQVMSSPDLRSDFDRTVTLYRDFILQNQTEPRISNISATTTQKQKGKKREAESDEPTIGPDEIQDRYYSTAEYRRMNADARTKLHKLREARGHTPTKSRSNGMKKAKGQMSIQQVTLNPSTVSALASEIASLSGGTQSSNGSQTTNRNNPALTRQPSLQNQNREDPDNP